MNRQDPLAHSACGFLTRVYLTGISVLLPVLLNPLSATAQSPRWQLDVSGSRIQYDTLDALNAPSLATSLEWQSSKFLARVGGSFTSFEGHGRSIQGRGDVVGWLSPAGVGSPIRLELRGGIDGSRHSSAFGSYLGQAGTRLHVQGARTGVWLGTSFGVSENTFDTDPLTSFVPNVGGWVQVGPGRLVARYLDTRVHGVRFPEASASGVYSRGQLDVTVFAGLRDPSDDGVGTESWFGGSVAVWVRPEIGLLFSGGQYAADVLRGLPGGDFLSVGIRYSPRRSRPVIAETPLPVVFTREAARSGEIGFRVDQARSVAIAGDWNEWQPTSLTRDSRGRWLLPPDIPVGVHRFNLLVDGKKWIVPEGVPSIDDDFGGKAGLLVIFGE